MNNTSGTTLTKNLVPVLDTFPKEAGQMVTKFKDMIHTASTRFIFNAI